MRALPILFVVVVAAAAMAQDSAPPQKASQSETKPVKVGFFWGEAKPVPGVTEEQGIVWGESGELLYLHKQPVLTNKDVVRVEFSKTVFGVGAIANEQFTVRFHLTREARKRLAETCGPSGDKMLAAVVDGRRCGNPYYLKSRDESDFVPFAGMLSSKAIVDRIVATFAKAAQDSEQSAPRSETPPARPRIKVELHWAEFKRVSGLTVDKGTPFGEEGTSLIFLHKQAVLTIEDVAEASVGGEFTVGAGDAAKKLHGVTLYFTEEGKRKLAKSGEPGKKKLLALLLDGRNPSAFYVDVADVSNFSQPVGFYEKKDAEDMVAGINSAAAGARAGDKADKPNAGNSKTNRATED